MIVTVLAMLMQQDPVSTCSAAVHGDLERVAKACAAPAQVDLFDGKGISDTCLASLNTGRLVSRTAPVGRQAMIREFDAQVAACRARQSTAPTPTPTLPMTQLWD